MKVKKPAPELSGVKDSKYKFGAVATANRDIKNLRQQVISKGESVTVLSSRPKVNRVLIESAAGVTVSNVPTSYLKLKPFQPL